MGWFQGLFQKNNPASPPPGPPHQSRGLLAWAKARLGWGGPAPDGQPSWIPAEITAGKSFWGPAEMLLPQFWPYLDPMGPGPPPRVLRKMFDSPYVKGATLGKILGVSSLDLQVRPFTKDPWDQKIAQLLGVAIHRSYQRGRPDMGSVRAGHDRGLLGQRVRHPDRA